MVIGGIIGSIVGLFLSVIAAVPLVSASNDCVDIDCLKQKLERICKDGIATWTARIFFVVLMLENKR